MLKPRTLLFAVALDLAAGDPHWLPHPVRIIGRTVSAGERLIRRFTHGPSGELIGGAALTLGVVTASYFSARVLIESSRRAHPVCGEVVETLLAWTTLAIRSLDGEARGVVVALDAGDLHLARERLRMVVGRDTAHLEEREAARAVTETVAEGTCDGVIAPLLYLTVGGVPLAFAYKAVNTLDSMIGHREPPYLYFGRTAARTDDAANYLPARLTALAIMVAATVVSDADPAAAWRVWRRDGSKHASPNAGQPEAAMAGALGVRLGGVNYYDGEPHRTPFLGAEYERPTAKAARLSLRVALIASLGACAAAALLCRTAKTTGPR